MKTHVLPLDFELHNADDEPLLLLGKSRDLKLEIWNTSPTALYLTSLTQEHHFSLRFRAGVLRDHDHIRLHKAQRADWDVETAEEDGDVLVHLRHKTAATWAAGRTLKLTLEGLRGNPVGGKRTTRVELDYQHIRHKDEGGPFVAGKPRHHQMLLAMPSPYDAQHRSLLEAHFVGDTGNVVLNDGRPHGHGYALRLRLTNTTAQWLLFEPTTELRVSLVGGHQDEAGALATPTQLQACTFTASVLLRDHEKTDAVREAMSRGWIVRTDVQLPCTQLLECRQVKDQLTWTFRLPENTPGPAELTPDGCLEIEIGNIVTAHANGPSSVRVEWLNLSHPEGELSGEVSATLQKSPLVVVGRQVGVGTPKPAAALDVHGDVHVQGRLVSPGTLEVVGKLKIPHGLELGNTKLLAHTLEEKTVVRTVAKPYTVDAFEAFVDWPAALGLQAPLTFTFTSSLPTAYALALRGAVRVRLVPASDDAQAPPCPVAFDSGPMPATLVASGATLTVQADPGSVVWVTDIPVQGNMKSLAISTLLCPDRTNDPALVRGMLADMGIAAGNWAHAFGRDGPKVVWTTEITYLVWALFVDVGATA